MSHSSLRCIVWERVYLAMAAWNSRQEDLPISGNKRGLCAGVQSRPFMNRVPLDCTPGQTGYLPMGPRTRARPFTYQPHTQPHIYLGMPSPSMALASFSPFETQANPSFHQPPNYSGSLPNPRAVPGHYSMMDAIPNRSLPNQIFSDGHMNSMQLAENIPMATRQSEPYQPMMKSFNPTPPVQFPWRPPHVPALIPHPVETFTNLRPGPQPIRYPDARLGPRLPSNITASSVCVVGPHSSLPNNSDPFIDSWLKEVGRREPHKNDPIKRQLKVSITF